jgi:hypothetical protein
LIHDAAEHKTVRIDAEVVQKGINLRVPCERYWLGRSIQQGICSTDEFIPDVLYFMIHEIAPSQLF